MAFFDSIQRTWYTVAEKTAPTREKLGNFCSKAGNLLGRAWRYTLKFKKLFLAIPVAAGAVFLAVRNLAILPDNVGLGLQIDGTFSLMFPKLLAVLAPMAVTALCLLLMFISKRVLTPWFVSLFSLTLPLLLWIINAYPG